MLILRVGHNSGYVELHGETDNFTFATGLMDEVEAVDAARMLVDVAADLLPRNEDYDHIIRQLDGARLMLETD